MAAAPDASAERILDDKEARFVEEYPTDLDARRAALAAGYSATVAASKAYQWVSDGKAKPHVFAAVQRALAHRAAKTGITQERVLEELWAIATADPNELIQFRRGACRKCWPSAAETEETLEPQGHGGALRRSTNAAVFIAEVDRDPNPECEECRGEGAGRAYIADTRKLSAAGKRLYAGVKITKEGVEVKMHDKASALINVGKHLGMFKDKVEHSHEGDLTVTTLTHRERAKALAALVARARG